MSESDSFNTYAEMSGKKAPYSRYLKGRAEYTVSGDTLIIERYDEFDELYHVNIQLGSNIWTGSNYLGDEYNFGELVHVSNFDVDICLVNVWKEVKTKRYENQRTKSYIGEAIQNEITHFEIKVFDRVDTIKNNEYQGLFCKIFCEYGLIIESIRTYRDNTTKMILEERIEEGSINCREKLNKYYLGE